MKAFYDESNLGHSPDAFFIRGLRHQSREKPERAASMQRALQKAGYDINPPAELGIEPILRIHTGRYIDFLRNGHTEWAKLENSSTEIIPNAFPVAPFAQCPSSIVGRSGYYMGDMACPINEGTWTAAYGAAQAALSATREVVQGATASYALCRPPGHHAYADRASGYCYLNNAAVAAQYCLDNGAVRVCILDLDLHHGNGTQDIFYDRNDVLFVSLHGDPATLYPFFWGYSDQVGHSDGKGYNLNIPLPLGTNGTEFAAGLDVAIKSILSFKPDVIVISLGLDTFVGDPYAAFAVQTADYRGFGNSVSSLRIPTVIVQEGGYMCPALGDNLLAFLEAFEGR